MDIVSSIGRQASPETRDTRNRAVVVNDNLGLIDETSRFLFVHTAFDLAGIAIDGYEALEVIGQLRLELITVGLRMPGLNGLDATEQLRRMFPSMWIIMTGTDDGADSPNFAGTTEPISFYRSDGCTATCLQPSDRRSATVESSGIRIRPLKFMP